LIMIFATLAEFAYIPTTWHNASHLTTRLAFLLVILALTVGPTFYIAMVDGRPGQNHVPLIIAIVQFFISVVASVAFGIIPSGRMFGDRVAGKARKYMASQTFTASYPQLNRSARTASIMLWILVFGCKFSESYFFLTSSFSSPIAVMARTKVQGCNDKLFGNVLCTNHVPFTLTIMYIMDLVLFFLDTYLWYIIWSVVFSIGRSFFLGLSIWTPWKDIFTRLPKRIYAKLLATADMEVKYKPKVYLVILLSQREAVTQSFTHRSWFLKSGMRLSYLCTVNIFSASNMSSASFTIKSTVLMAVALSVRRPSLPIRVVRASRGTFSLRAAKRSAESPSLPHLSPRHSRNLLPSRLCLPSPF
jgi:hypothetical protein